MAGIYSDTDTESVDNKRKRLVFPNNSVLEQESSKNSMNRIKEYDPEDREIEYDQELVSVRCRTSDSIEEYIELKQDDNILNKINEIFDHVVHVRFNGDLVGQDDTVDTLELEDQAILMIELAPHEISFVKHVTTELRPGQRLFIQGVLRS